MRETVDNFVIKKSECKKVIKKASSIYQLKKGESFVFSGYSVYKFDDYNVIIEAEVCIYKDDEFIETLDGVYLNLTLNDRRKSYAFFLKQIFNNNVISVIEDLNICDYYSLVSIDEYLTNKDYYRHLASNDRLIDDLDIAFCDIKYISDDLNIMKLMLNKYYYSVTHSNKMINVVDSCIVKSHYDYEDLDFCISEIIQYADISTCFFATLMLEKYGYNDDRVIDLDSFYNQGFYTFNGFNECVEDDVYSATTYLRNDSYKGIIISQDIYYKKHTDSYLIELEDVDKVVYTVIDDWDSTYNIEEEMMGMRKLTLTKDENGNFVSIFSE